MNNTVSVSQICRICLTVEGTVDLFLSNESEKILNMVYVCFQIILTFEKDLPKLICTGCLKELNMANNFRLKCILFEERFKIVCDKFSYGKTEAVLKNLNPTNEGCTEISSDTNESISNDTSGETKKEAYSTLQMKECPNISENFKCDICNKVLKSNVSLVKHTISMHQKRKHVGKVTGTGASRRYHCIKCLYSTPYSQTLVSHMRKHNGERPYQCECGKSFTHLSSFTAHKKTHSDTTYYTCSTCGKQFKHSNSLKNHLRVHESGKLSCNICQKVLKSRVSLQDHMHRHYNIRNYNCEDCGDTFVTSSELINHRKKHKEKTKECHLCGHKTHTKKNLAIHLKRHAGSKEYKCELCEVTMYTMGDLQRHRRVHTREKPYSCPTCSQRFAQSSSLNKHMLTIHGVDYKWGDLKKKESRKIKPLI